MVKDRRVSPHRLAWGLLAAMAAVAASPLASDDPATIRLSGAAERGAFNVGAAQATVGVATDPEAGEVLKLDYTIPKGTAAGVWAKRFPGGLKAGGIDVVRPAAKVGDPAQAGQVALTLELKGSAGVQRVPILPGTDWSAAETEVDWKAIGEPTEFVVAVARAGDAETAKGSILLDVRFERLTPLRKLSTSQTARVGGVVLLAALLAGLIRMATGRWGGRGPSTDSTDERGGLGRDLVQGVGAAAIFALGIVVYQLGGMGRLEIGWTPLGLAIAGVLIAEWWKYGLTGRHLTAGEVFLDAIATGLLAAASSPLAILQAPRDWSELLMLSQPVASVVALLYHASNAGRISSTGKHLGAIAGGIIVGIPFTVGGLLLLEAGPLVRELGDVLTLGRMGAWPEGAEFAGRVLVLFLFNEIVTNAIGLATRRTLLKSAQAHAALLAVAVAAIVAPWIADFGSGRAVADLPSLPRLIVIVLTTILSQAGLWGEAYLLTGLVMDALGGKAPSRDSVWSQPIAGMKKGMVYSGTFMGGLNGLALLGGLPGAWRFAEANPLIVGAAFGAAVFPLLKTIIETFDGSQAFFRRVGKSYQNPVLYLRGAVVGLGMAYAFAHDLPELDMAARVWFGFGVGFAAFGGVNLARDWFEASRGRGRVKPVRVYLVHGLLGGAIGAAIGFYLDAVQVRVVIDKYLRYIGSGQKPQPYDVYPLLSKWGFIRLGDVTGGVALLFDEALAGVTSWAIPSWLFAINRTFMSAYFEKQAAPIKALFTRAGLIELAGSMIGVLRWGLWMSPIINSFLRQMGEPTWYNQDGAIRTVIATVHDATTTHADFRAWSLGVFIALLAHDWVRILIWLDHMGLRVATLVNLSFLGMDRLDRKLSRFLAPDATARCIPEGVKRFTTWAPLLIPFYIPRDADWDTAWSRSQAIIAAEHGGPLASFLTLPTPWQGLIGLAIILASSAAFSTARRLRDRASAGRRPDLSLSNHEYEVTLKGNGELLSRVRDRDYDVSRRSYDLLDPAGRALFLVDLDGDGSPTDAWPILGNVPAELAEASQVGRGGDALRVLNTSHGLRASIEIGLPSSDDSAELWSIAIENPGDAPRRIKVVPYLEWVLNKAEADRGHTQYNRLFAEVEYAGGLHAVLAWDKHSKAMGLLAADVRPEGFLSSRMDFIGRARSLWSPRVLETLAFTEAKDTDSHPTFDPIGSLLLGATVPARGTATIRLLIGLARDKRHAIDLISRHLSIPLAGVVPAERRRKVHHAIGHGEIPPGTPRPYAEFADDGRKLVVRTPFTTRPFDHTLSNALGHVVVVTNRGLHTSASVNAQQNRLTPDWSDTVTKEVPSEAFYLHDPATGEWFSPTHHPTNDPDATYEAEFGVDGTATFRMTKGTIETELTVFVPPDEPTGVYRLTVHNHGDSPRHLRVVPYFQMVLSGQPEFSGPLEVRHDADLNALFFVNPRNTFRTGPAFAAMSGGVAAVETSRGRFFGEGRSLAHPGFVAGGGPDPSPTRDDRPIAAFLAETSVPSRGQATVVVVLGQADDRAAAEAVVRKYRDPAASLASLEETRAWWLALMGTVAVETADPEFDRYLDWLKYQALAERIWARRGFYQASGAYGFRDQLQDSVNLIWMDPAIARRQILLHASQQFPEGDVVHWFHLLQDGRTGFVGRTHASDNPLWLAWGVVEYVIATGDRSLLDERTAYLDSDQPFEPLPAGKGGMGFDPLRSSLEDSVYRHCMKAIDLVLDRRMGAHGLPLMGTGDWNDGLDEIGSEGRGESVWLGFFLHYILERMAPIVGLKDGEGRRDYYLKRLDGLKAAIEATWRHDRYLRAINDDGVEIGVAGSGVWEIDALTAGWAVMSGINPERGKVIFATALGILEKEKTILLGSPPLREDTKPYLGRSSWYPEGVRENGMYCHGVQWLVGAARLLAEGAARSGRADEARHYAETAHRLWMKISAIPHTRDGEIETYGGQPNQQAADMVTTFDPGRMIWNGYTGAAGWMFRQAIEGVLGMRLSGGAFSPPTGPTAIDVVGVSRDLSGSPFLGSPRPSTPPPPVPSPLSTWPGFSGDSPPHPNPPPQGGGEPG